MHKAILTLPCEEYIDSYIEACRETNAFLPRSGRMHNPDMALAWRPTLIARYEQYRNGQCLPAGFVPATTFWMVEDGVWIGEGSIRHRLNDALWRYGGHIGYTIRRSKWGQGYGTHQLALLLPEAAKLGIDRALLTCNEQNIASARIMEKNGGVYWDTIDNVIDGQSIRTKRYWIEIKRG